jgi:hypothetical protein
VTIEQLTEQIAEQNAIKANARKEAIALMAHIQANNPNIVQTFAAARLYSKRLTYLVARAEAAEERAAQLSDLRHKAEVDAQIAEMAEALAR